MASVHVNVLVVLSHSFQCPHPFSLPLFFFKFHPSKISLVPSYLFTLGHFRPLFLPLFSLPQIHFRNFRPESPLRSTFTRTPDHPLRPLPVHHIRSIKAQTATLSLNSFLEIHQLSLFFYVELSFIDNEGRGRKGGERKITSSNAE